MGVTESEYHTLVGIQALERERAEVIAERDAFEEFQSRVADQSLSGPMQGCEASGSVVQSINHSGSTRNGCRKALDIYRETVMDVPHYQNCYGEPVEENLRFEFGPELANYLTNGKQLSRVAQSTLIQEADRARRQRAEFVDVLEDERADLKNAAATITDLQSDIEELNERRGTRSTAALQDWPDRLTAMQETCESLVAERQETFRQRSRRELQLIEVDQLATYLYRSLSVDHPVLADVADVSRLVRTNRNHIERELINR